MFLIIIVWWIHGGLIVSVFHNQHRNKKAQICSVLSTCVCSQFFLLKFRVRTGHRKPGKSWNLRISFSRPGKSWSLIVSPGKSWKIKVLCNILVTADDKARTVYR